MSDPRVAPSRPAMPIGGGPWFAGRGAVGYQPVITVLPEGANFSVTGVISADRRYVRITPQFIVSQIKEVSTFTFAGAAQSNPPNNGTNPPGGGTNPPGGGTNPPDNGGGDVQPVGNG